MMNVITSEFYKIFRSKIFYAITIMLLAMNVLLCINSITFKMKGQMVGTGITTYLSFYSGDIISYIILIFVACLITAEYSNGTIRQMASHGIPRWKLVLGQYIAISLVITLALILFGVINLLIDTVLFQLGEADVASFIRTNIGVICMFWGMSGIGTFLSYLFKNGGLTVAISIFLIIGGNYILYFLNLITKNDIFTRYSLTNMRRIIIDLSSEPNEVVKCTILFLLIGIVTIWGACILFTKRDID
jgi:ABC-2 type transport system permease protein